MTLRACIACPAVYRGGLACPDCGEPGEPLDDDTASSASPDRDDRAQPEPLLVLQVARPT